MTLTIDGSTGSTAGTNPVTLTLSTTQANDIIIVASAHNDLIGIVSISDTAGLTWTQRATTYNGSGDPIQSWYAISTGILTNDVITINYNGSAFCTACAFGVSGANIASPFDTNGSLPVEVTSSTVTGLSTSNANDMILSFYRQSSTATPTNGTGFTTIYAPSGGYFIAQYKIVSSTQSSLSIGINGGTTNADSNGGIGDAIKAAGGGGGRIFMEWLPQYQ